MKNRWISAAVLVGMCLLCGCGEKQVNSARVQSKAEQSSENGGAVQNEEGTQKREEAQADAKDLKPAAAQKEIETENTEKKDEICTVTITAAGDCTFASVQNHGYEGSFYEYYDQKGEDYFFSGVRDFFEEDDLTLINLECVLSNSKDRVEKTFNLKGKPEYTNIMTSSSVEACSLGNNHSSDYGEKSLKDTQKVLDQAEILYGYNDHVSVFTTDQGVKVGMVSANLLSMSREYENYIKKGIEKLRKQGADLVIASCHWGIEREYYANDYQVSTAHKIVDWGADLVIGCHPHVLQGIEYYKGKVICYSMGNFCFGGNSNPTDKDTMLFRQTFHFRNKELEKTVDARIIPCRLSSESGYNNYHPVPAKDQQKEKIIKNMNAYSKPYGSVQIVKDGKIQVKK